MSPHTTNIAIQRETQRIRSCFGNRQRSSQNRICTQLGFIGSAVQIDQCLIDFHLLGSIHADNFVGNYLVDIFNRFLGSFSKIALLITVAEFQRFMNTG